MLPDDNIKYTKIFGTIGSQGKTINLIIFKTNYKLLVYMILIIKRLYL